MKKHLINASSNSNYVKEISSATNLTNENHSTLMEENLSGAIRNKNVIFVEPTFQADIQYVYQDTIEIDSIK